MMIDIIHYQIYYEVGLQIVIKLRDYKPGFYILALPLTI